MSRIYEGQGEHLLRRIVVNGRVSIDEGYTQDDWNGGTYGHALAFALPEDLYVECMNERPQLTSRLDEDLNKLNGVQNEHIAEVFLELDMADDPLWRENSGLLRRGRIVPTTDSESLRRIWGDGHVRVFLSHRANVKAGTAMLKAALARYGVGCFVAHEDIQPLVEWQPEIERALHSMHAMVALVTPDFHNNTWTDQEVGFAVGNGMPLIAVCLGAIPGGFIGKRQGLRGLTFDDTDAMAARIYALLHKRLPDRTGLFEAALATYAGSLWCEDSAWCVKNVLAAFGSLTKRQIGQVREAFRDNEQNRESGDGWRALRPLLKRWTNRDWTVKEFAQDEAAPNTEDPPGDMEIPF